MEVLTYVPSNISLLISGYRIEGWNRISIARNSPTFKQIRGIRGKNTRVRNKDTSATLTIETIQTGLVNEVLSMVLEADEVQGTARLEISLKDMTGTGFFSTTTGYITAYPEMSYSGDIGSVVWTIACDESLLHIGNAESAAVGIVNNGVSRLKGFVSNLYDQAVG